MPLKPYKSNFEGWPLSDVRSLANEGRDIVYKNGRVPRNSPEALAIAAMMRLEPEKKPGSWGRDRDHRKTSQDEEQAA
jgi:hypothetical protein